MYGEHRKSAQGRWLAAIERLAPAAAANRLGDLSEKNVPFWRLIENTVRVLLFLMFIQTRRAFDVRLFLGEACLIYLAFLGSALSGAIVLMLPTLAFLRLRDAYIDLAEGFPQDTVKDCFLTAAFMVVFEKVLLASAAPAYALGGDVLYRGIVGATVMLAAWRVIFRTRQAPEDPERRKMRQSYRSVARMTWVW